MRVKAILAFSLLLVPASLGAQMRSQSRGFMLNLHAVGNTIKGADWDSSEGGAGLGLTIAYGFSPNVMLLFQGDVADVSPDIGEPYVLGLGDLSVRYTFANSQKVFLPFIQGGFTALSIGYEDVPSTADYELLGGGFNIGGGASFYLSRAFAIELGVALTHGKFTRQKIQDQDPVSLGAGKFSANSARITAGLSWHPSKSAN